MATTVNIPGARGNEREQAGAPIVHHGPAPEKVYSGAVNALARRYKWPLETLGLRIDPVTTALSLAYAASPAFPIAGLPKRKRLADRPQLLRGMKSAHSAVTATAKRRELTYRG